MAVIPADVPQPYLREALWDERIKPLGPVTELTEADISDSTYLVAQMGIEPFIKALDGGADVILAGRSYDPAVFAAFPVWKGFKEGLALHLGKILECAAIAALPGSGSDCMVGFLEEDRFMVEPANRERRATVASVAAHTLYEKSNPYLLPGPGGDLDLYQTEFTQVAEHRVAVKGSSFRPKPYTVKVEGAKKVGYRVITIAGARDPRFIEHLDEIIAGVEERTVGNFQWEKGKYKLMFHIYGRNGVMGDQEPHPSMGNEVGIVIEAWLKQRNWQKQFWVLPVRPCCISDFQEDLLPLETSPFHTRLQISRWGRHISFRFITYYLWKDRMRSSR